MINLTHWLRSIGFLSTPLTPEQMRMWRCRDLAWRIRAVQMCELHNETGYGPPSGIREVWR